MDENAELQDMHNEVAEIMGEGARELDDDLLEELETMDDEDVMRFENNSEGEEKERGNAGEEIFKGLVDSESIENLPAVPSSMIPTSSSITSSAQNDEEA